MRSGGRDARAYVKRAGWTFVVIAALVWVGSAPAATPPPPEDIPAVSAYVELIPTSGGSRPSRPKAGGAAKARLPARVEAQLERDGGTDAALLREVATSEQYGAPAASRENGAPRPALQRPELDGASDQTSLAAGVRVVTDGSSGRVVVLTALLLAMTVAAAAAAAYRYRTGRRGLSPHT